MKTAIFGGSFNPVHRGHLKIAEAVTHLGIGRVILMPNETTYYKDHTELADDRDRMAMLSLAAETAPYLEVSDMEIRRGGITHTVDTIREIRKNRPELTERGRVIFVIGGDSLKNLGTWVDADELLRTTIFLAALRDDMDLPAVELRIRKYRTDVPETEIHLLSLPPDPVSSSEIRDRIRRGQSVRDLVPEKVAAYISAHHLYRQVQH